jgi:putative FmdB family regulatory protein
MPLYEYYCPVCDQKFELLRPMSRATEPAACPAGHGDAERVISVFSALAKSADGDVSPVASSSGCATCSADDCSSCPSF